VQDKDAAVLVAAEKPSVAVLAVVNLALMIGHLGLRELIIDRQPHRCLLSPCSSPGLCISVLSLAGVRAVGIFSAAWVHPDKER
jgi:hypothetical protein